MNKPLLHVLLPLLICLTLPLAATAQVVDIPDPNLRAAIENALGKASGATITAADMAKLTRLKARNANISDLTGLEHATNLTRLNLGDNAVTDISVLAGLTNLTDLFLYFNDITDISVLARLTNLTELNLGGNNLSNISPIAGLTNLRQLWLWSNNITDISPVAGLTNLIELILQSNALTDISAVSGLTNLTGLWLAYNTISDLSPLVANTGLGSGDRVFVNDNPLGFVSINTHIPALQSRGVTVEFDDRTPATLLLISGVITDLNNVLIVEVRDSQGLPLEGVPVTFTITSGGGTLSITRTTTDENGRAESRLTLRSGGGTNTVRASVEGLAESVTFSDVALDIPDPNLRTAIENALGVTPGTPIAPQAMAALTRLEASDANISDLTGLQHATNLTWLNLGFNNISDISPLVDLTNLTALRLYVNSITDISAVVGLANLIKLHLGNNSITDISSVASLTNLIELSLGANNIGDISSLVGLTNLKTLRLERNYIVDVSPLLGLTNLAWLGLKNNYISDLSPLVANTGLGNEDEVVLNDNPLSSASIKTYVPVLQSRGVTVEFDDTTHLNVGQPREVRLIYFLPSDHPYHPEVVQLMKDRILQVQTFFAEQMEAHGYGNKTFRVETDASGEPMVHRVDGQYPDHHYSNYWGSILWPEIGDVFNRYTNIYLIVHGSTKETGGEGGKWGKNAGTAVVESDVNFTTTAHELGHAFGLWHDFRDGSHLMSYGPGSKDQLAACHAEYLAVHPYFNPDTPIEQRPPPTIELISPRTYPADAKSIPIRLKASDSDGLHQAILHLGPPDNRNRITVKACRGLGGKKEAVVQFDYDGVIPFAHNLPYSRSTSLKNPLVHPIFVEAVDTNGNVGEQFFFLYSDMYQPSSQSASHTLSKISGDNQQGLPNTPLAQPFVIEVRDSNGFTFTRGGVQFAVTAGGGTLSRQLTKTDGNGRASSTLTLGPNLGTNTVEVSVDGIEGAVTFTAVAVTVSGTAVEIPDPNLRAAIENALGKNAGEPITAVEMAILTELEAQNANISDLTGLEHATNLTRLNLGVEWIEGRAINNNSVSNLSPLSGLTNLTGLYLDYNNISDISPVAGLLNLTSLDLDGNSITNISAVVGLTNLTWLDIWGTPISDISPLAGLLNLTSLGLGHNNISDISPVAGLTNLTGLYLPSNYITDISSLSGLTNLKTLWLNHNNISDLSPLVTNTGLGSGDEVNVRENLLSYTSIKTHIPVLQSRGITVEFDNQAHPALLKISGDNQKGASFTPLSQPFVVDAQDVNGSALVGVSVKFAVIAGGGTLSTTNTRTDTNGRAQSTLTLGPNLGTNTVEVFAAGIQGKVTFHALSDTEAPPISADVNSDGVVNVLDLISIASKLGHQGQNLATDVNQDGVVSILDLILVAGMFKDTAAAPSTQPQIPETLTAVEVQGWLTEARRLEDRDSIMQRGILVLEQLLISLTPKETELLANYPNPFNPETWIPYRLAEDAFVTLTIYDLRGRVVRTLNVGHRIASAYENRSKAIYWDGRNDVGEPVASGVYFYTLAAGDYSATRRMVILK